jgi:hypothetical protein
MKMYELLKEFIKPELLILVPVLYLVGMAIKKSAIDNKFIPFILGGVSIFLTLIYLASVNTDFSVQGMLLLVFTGITQGILIAGASVYVNQLIKQSKE